MARVPAFQAGYAGSIPVTRSIRPKFGALSGASAGLVGGFPQGHHCEEESTRRNDEEDDASEGKQRSLTHVSRPYAVR
jgi:hypothetical protein